VFLLGEVTCLAYKGAHAQNFRSKDKTRHTSTIKLLQPRSGSSRKSMSRITWKQCGLSCFKVTSAAFSLSAASCPATSLIATISPVSDLPCIGKISVKMARSNSYRARGTGIATVCPSACSLDCAYESCLTCVWGSGYEPHKQLFLSFHDE
jgi:hypothetical protein